MRSTAARGRVGIGDVEVDRLGAGLGGDARGALVVDVADEDVGALGGEPGRDRLADPARAAGDQRLASLESHRRELTVPVREDDGDARRRRLRLTRVGHADRRTAVANGAPPHARQGSAGRRGAGQGPSAAGNGPRSPERPSAAVEHGRPDTPLASAVERVARERQSARMLAHALRTVALAHALASLDAVRFDVELLWCACLLHDVALESPAAGRCFAVRGGEIARETALDAGSDRATAEALGDAVSRHATPGLDPGRHPPAIPSRGRSSRRRARPAARGHGCRLRRRARSQHSRGMGSRRRSRPPGAPRHGAVRGGRAALAERPLCFSLAARAAPLPR